MKILFSLILVAAALLAHAQTGIPSTEIQIKDALLAAPEEARDGAAVLGYDPKGELVTLKKGTNYLICLADDPNIRGFSCACYHKDLEPFMARGRELRKEGKSGADVFKIRGEEVASGKLSIPKGQSATLAVYYAPEEKYNSTTGEVDGHLRYVIYIPFGTAESTGLPNKPTVDGGPWIMDAGTYHAHIMITPATGDSGD